MSELEICEVCEEATGKAGGVEDSLYLENWGGPFCDECYDSQVEELANSYGAVKAMALKYRATIAAKDAEIAKLKASIADRDAEIERLKEVSAAVISNDPEDHKPVCCGGSIQDMCGCMGATPSSIAEHELRQLLEATHD